MKYLSGYLRLTLMVAGLGGLLGGLLGARIPVHPTNPWELYSVPPMTQNLLAYHGSRLYVQTANGKMYGCSQDNERCQAVSLAIVDEDHFDIDSRECGCTPITGSTPPGELQDTLAVDLCGVDYAVSWQFVLMKNGQVWHKSDMLYANADQSARYTNILVGGLLGSIFGAALIEILAVVYNIRTARPPNDQAQL